MKRSKWETPDSVPIELDMKTWGVARPKQRPKQALHTDGVLSHLPDTHTAIATVAGFFLRSSFHMQMEGLDTLCDTGLAHFHTFVPLFIASLRKSMDERARERKREPERERENVGTMTWPRC